MAIWHAALSTLRRQALPCLETQETLSRAEDLWQQARTEIGEAEKRVQGYHELQGQQQAQIFIFTRSCRYQPAQCRR